MNNYEKFIEEEFPNYDEMKRKLVPRDSVSLIEQLIDEDLMESEVMSYGIFHEKGKEGALSNLLLFEMQQKA